MYFLFSVSSSKCSLSYLTVLASMMVVSRVWMAWFSRKALMCTLIVSLYAEGKAKRSACSVAHDDDVEHTGFFPLEPAQVLD
jgi:hypothetical protein